MIFFVRIETVKLKVTSNASSGLSDSKESKNTMYTIMRYSKMFYDRHTAPNTNCSKDKFLED